MKHLSIIGSVALFGAALFSGAASATCTGNDNGSLIHNGGFESGSGSTISGWKIADTSDTHVNIATSFKRGGSQSLALGTSGFENRISQPITGAVPGDAYTVCFWVYNQAAGGTSSLRAQWNNQDMTIIRNSISNNNGTFSYYSFNVVATGSDVLSFEERNDPSFFFLDNVDVQLCGCTLNNGPRMQKTAKFEPFKQH
jgi:hypothetical protein